MKGFQKKSVSYLQTYRLTDEVIHRGAPHLKIHAYIRKQIYLK